MIIDGNLEFSSAQDISGAGSVTSTNYIDLGEARNLGVGEPLSIVVDVTTTLADTSSDSTVTVTLQGSSSSSFDSHTDQVLCTIPAVSVAGTKFVALIQPDLAGNFEFVRIVYTINTENLIAGAVTAAIVKNADQYTSYKRGFTIS